MMSFRDVTRIESTEDKLGYLASRITIGDAEELFVEAGELEQGVIDALAPRRDGWGPVERRLRALTVAAAAASLASRTGRAAAPHLKRARAAAGSLESCVLPATLEVRAPEGYTHYALDPVSYALAARRYAREAGRKRAERAVVLGIRSVGTGLSGMVAAELCAERSVTLRPRGAPGQRAVSVTTELYGLLLSWLQVGGDALIVDEGPGATGETFHCVAGWLRQLGVPAGRIVLFPSGLQAPGLASTGIREFFERSRRYPPAEQDGRVERVCKRFQLTDPEDLSAGRWREVVPGARAAVAIPRHERLKCRVRDANGRQCLIRYGGLGRAGVESALRAECLASAGFGPALIGREEGFLVSEWVDGQPVDPKSVSSASFFVAVAGYLSTRLPLFRTGAPADVGPVLEMLRENTCDAPGGEPDGLRAALVRLERMPPREASITDARVQAREWLCTRHGYSKVDMTDHGDGVRLPGPIDPAWDLAGAAVEFGLADAAMQELVHRCARGRAGEAAELSMALEAYRAPYAACQLGEMVLAARELSETPDGRPLEREAARYRRLLGHQLARCAVDGAAVRLFTASAEQSGPADQISM